MQTSQEGLDLIKASESCSCTAYPDPGSPLGLRCAQLRFKVTDYAKVPNWRALNGSPWTIGWGHTGKEVVAGLIWTQAQCDTALVSDLRSHEAAVGRLAKVPLKQCQFDALVSFAYNVGDDENHDGKAQGLGDSTLMKLVNVGDIAHAADEFPKWNKSSGVVLNGLVLRRARERALFLGLNWRDVAHG